MCVERPKTILLVEDESIIAFAETQTIKRFGYAVVVANSGEKAIEVVTEDWGIDLVLMDINLGAGIDGPEAARRILKMRDVPIVFLTSHSEKRYVDRIKKITRYGYVIKNSSDFVLQSSIEMAFELFEANEKVRLERDLLRTSDERCREIIEWMSDYIYTVYYVNNEIVKTVHNPACIAITGYSVEEFNADPYLWFRMIDPEDRDRVVKETERILYKNGRTTIEHRIRRKDGTLRWIRNTHVPHFDSSGALVSRDGIVVDITERRLAEEKVKDLLQEKEILLREVHHRIKNNMTTLTSLLSLQADSAKEANVGAAFRDTLNRVRSMQVLYDKLYRHDNSRYIFVREYFDDLLSYIKSALCPESNITVELRVADVLLDTDDLFPLGIIANELITNALKYAFPLGRSGTIRLDFRAATASECVLEVADDGIGLPEKIKIGRSPGLGLVLIEALTEQLHGSAKIVRGVGTDFTIQFPIKEPIKIGVN
jgi:PAS domain S-box-containing protein